MSPDERARIELAQRLTDLFGDELAAYLMETLPPFSWHEVATNRDLRELEARLDLKFDLVRAEARELQQETIAVVRGELVSNTRQMMYGTVAAMGVVATAIIAAVKI